jgi:hypothetical protein
VQAAATLNWEPSPGDIAIRVLRRAARKLALSPITWLLIAVTLALLVAVNGRTLTAPLALASPSKDAADTYVQALRSGDVDAFLSSLAPQARTQLRAVGRFAGVPSSQAERRAARVVLAQDHIDRYTRLSQHQTEDGSFVVYAIERDAADGTHTIPLVVWLDQDGHVVRSSF